MRHLRLFEDFAQENQNLVDFVKKESYFEYEESDDADKMVFITRKNGDVGDGTAGAEDVKEANRLAKLIKDEFGFRCEVEMVDEWVYLNVVLVEKKDKFSYVLYKHDGSLDNPGWRGFAESHPLDKLAGAIVRWTLIGKSKADEMVKQLEGMPLDGENYRGKYAEVVIPSKNMGYSWAIRKWKE